MITLDDLIELNSYICEDSGEECIVINANNLLSALSVQQWYEDEVLLASALIRSLIIGHGFQDGNKRTAGAVGAAIKDFECSEDEVIRCILSVAKGELREVEDIASILYPHSSKGAVR